MAQDQPPSRPHLFLVSNHHVAGCGVPPQISGDTPGRRYSYFVNEHGEQAIFEFDLETKTGRLWLGDAGWEESHEVINGFVPDLVLSPSEALWVGACWYAATGKLPKALDEDRGTRSDL
jgi:hypothetical protein